MKKYTKKYLISLLTLGIEIILFCYFLFFPVIKEEAYYFNTDNIEKFEKANAITDNRSSVLTIQPDGENVTSISIGFYVTGDVESGMIEYQVLDNDVQVSDGVVELNQLSSDTDSLRLTKIPVNIENTNGINVIFNGKNIPAGIKAGVYINDTDTESYVSLDDEGINKYQIPIFQLNTYKKSYPYQWDLLLLMAINGIWIVLLKEKKLS